MSFDPYEMNNPYEPGTSDYDGFEFFKITNSNWSFTDEQDADIWESSEASRYLLAQRAGFTSIVKGEWTFDTLSNAMIREWAEAQTHLATIDWLRS